MMRILKKSWKISMNKDWKVIRVVLEIWGFQKSLQEEELMTHQIESQILVILVR